MTPELKQRIDKDAVEYATKHSSAPDKETPDWIIADYKAGATVWAERAEKLREVLEEIKRLTGIESTQPFEIDDVANIALEQYKKETA